MSLVLQPLQVTPDTAVGGKARALASLSRAGLPVPGWFVILPAAFEASLSSRQRAALRSVATADTLSEVLGDLALAPELAVEVEAAYAMLCPDAAPVAVRSSAADEDSARFSFAGQLESYLSVTRDALLQRIADVWRSGFNERIFAYRRNAELDPVPPPPAVIVQRLAEGDVSGVAFSADPVSGRRGVAVVAAVWGLGQALVSGEVDADTWHVGRDGQVLKRRIAAKRSAVRRDPSSPGGTRLLAVDEELVTKPTLSEQQVAEVARLARDTQRHFGRPQDIEWTLQNGTLALLQSRPITKLADQPDPDAPPSIWDNTNIIESYSGVTTPMTFSFIRRCYEQVYREFCRLMRVPKDVIEANASVFACLLGLLNGRVYYNMLNGYRLLTLLPGYRFNRRFTEEMLGFHETLPDEIQAQLERAAVSARARDLLHLLATLWGLGWSFLRIESRIGAFYRRLRNLFHEAPADLSMLRLEELVGLYQRLESQLLHHWDAPVINDFFAAIFHGALRRLTARWLDHASGSLHNDLLSGDRRLISMHIAEQLQRMSALAAGDPELPLLLREASPAEVERHMAGLPALESAYRDYLERFGDRCSDELKLESHTLRDDPTPLLRAMGSLAERLSAGHADTAPPQIDLREQAETVVRQAMAGHPLRRLLFGWVLRQTRERVCQRENLRFERTRAYGIARRIIVEIGRRLAALDLIEQERDIFYLTVEEILALVEGTAVTVDLRALVGLRRVEFDRYQAMPSPAARFQTRDIPYLGRQFAASPVRPAAAAGESLTGVACCPGVVRGRVILVEDLRSAQIAPGSIVVARRTDPGWVMVFSAAAGLLVERGSLLSHSAIVAREMGLPTIVSIAGLTDWLRDGDLVEMDGGRGSVTRLDEAA